ncbi:related to alternative oxidase precursor, mitochondrial [Cephalotrichum gorgonifer]|uniref:Alternative oxidase n=1 Tax=Cephalotrichum gorgonifer TaxID=2041049 RepID=A0AAE8SRF7_9PEZI|nr:related to alternative oxidase precursor, mitochondrial [Cephalotrichum gorgonifer]
MLATRAPRLVSARQIGQMAKAAALTHAPVSTISTYRPILGAAQNLAHHSQIRHFSILVTDKIPEKDPPKTRVTKPIFPGPTYTEEELLAVVPGHRQPRCLSDRLAWRLVRGARRLVDRATGVTDVKPLTTTQYNARILFLESIAAVPGMVAAVHRHLYSLRKGKRDQGWMKTLLEEAHNERMHLLTWMNLAEPGWFMRLLFIGAQGVFFNICFFARWVSPNFFHRFVGYLEEEAIHTYTRLEKEIENGQVKGWSDPTFPIPEIAIEYWNIPKDKQTMLWLTRYIRADEAGHRGVNHTFANLDQKHDPNPFEQDTRNTSSPVPNAILRPQGFERFEVIEGVKPPKDESESTLK